MNSAASPPDLFKQFESRLHKFQKRLHRYIAKGDEDSIHDVRTSIRRLRAAYSAIPGAGKPESSDRYMNLCRKFFSRNSRIRDSDVIKGKLLEQHLPEDDGLLKSLAKHRGKQLRHAMKLATRLSHLQGPGLKRVSDDKLASYEHEIEIVTEKFLHYLPIVLSDQAGRKDIHALRKATKKLFYLFELDPGSVLPEQRTLHCLKQLQKLSGDICDCDVTIEFLRGQDGASRGVTDLLDSEVLLRKQCYAEMCSFLRSENWFALLGLKPSAQIP